MIPARIAIVFCLLAAALPAIAADPVVVGSKRFTESYVLGEIARQVLVDAGVPAVHRQGLGNTAVMEQALATGSIALYPEYTGTIVRELLKKEGAQANAPSLQQINEWLAPKGLKAVVPLGFNNSYALAMREDDAARLGIATLSDLARASAPLRFGLSHEFLVRADGWNALKAAYGLPFTPGGGLDHGLAYQALARKQVDVVDAYTTDAQIARLRLRVLRDDRNFFPRYDAVLLMRATLDERPLAAALASRIDDRAMQAMNAEAEIDGRTFAQVAGDFIARNKAAGASRPEAAQAARATQGQGFLDRLFAPDLPRLLREHLALVFASVAIATAIGIPAGVLAARRPRLGRPVMALIGVLQTVPSRVAGLPDRAGGRHRLRARPDGADALCAAADRAQHACGARIAAAGHAAGGPGAGAAQRPGAARHRTAAGRAHHLRGHPDRRRAERRRRDGRHLHRCRGPGRAHRGRAGGQRHRLHAGGRHSRRHPGAAGAVGLRRARMDDAAAAGRACAGKGLALTALPGPVPAA